MLSSISSKRFNHVVAGVGAFLHKVAKGVQTLMGWMLLSLVYLLGIGPAALLGKIIGKTFLKTKLDENAATYWVNPEPSGDFYRQF